MKKEVVLIFFVGQVLLTGCKKGNQFNKDDWKLTFNEEFTDTVLNRNIWTAGLPWGQSTGGNNDQQLFIDSVFFIKNGILNIVAKRDTVMGNVYDADFNPVQKEFYFTSGLIHTRNSFAQQYGYFEIRSRVPYGRGFWPAFWIFPYTGFPEIDIFEIDGKKPNSLLMTNHFMDNSGTKRQNSYTFFGPDFSTDFHTFAIEWNPNEIIWYLDNQEIYSTSKTGIPMERMFLILSMSVGGDLSGDADQSTPFPSSFEIDYVRVYQKK